MVDKKKQHQGKTAPVVITDVKPRYHFTAPSKKTLLITVASIIVMIVASSVVIYKMTHRPIKVDLKTGVALNSQVEAMSDEQLDAVAGANVDAAEDINKAYAKALALAMKDSTNEAVTEYKEIIKAGAPYYMVADYALALAQKGDVRGAAEATQQAIDRLKADPKVDSDIKKSETEKLTNKLIGFKQEAGLL